VPRDPRILIKILALAIIKQLIEPKIEGKLEILLLFCNRPWLRVARPKLSLFLLLALSTAGISLADEITISVSGNKRTRTSYIENIVNNYLARNHIDNMINVDAERLKDLIVDKELFSEVNVNIVGNRIDIKVKDRWTLIPIPIATAQSGQDTKFGLFVMETNLFGYGKTGILGGLYSQAQSSFFAMYYRDSNTAIFKGTVSLEINGGFASTLTISRSYKLGGYYGILLRVKGDGKKYQFRMRTDDRFDGVSYRYEFSTEFNTWMIIDIPFHKCVQVFRGRILEDVEPILPEEIQQIGFLISNKQAGKFQLEIDWIKASKK
jgi:monofunctional biosynthetic peptidoglycan transglycosylase